jgi:hypothetical protein
MEPTDILQSANNAVASRGQIHGDGNILFQMIAERWTLTLLQRHGITSTLTPADVAFMMIDFKLARAISAPGNAENPVDVAGYAALLGSFTADKA